MSTATRNENVESGMKVAVVLMTPDKAKKLLEMNVCNRALRRKLVDKWAKSMKAGEWKLNGEAIKVSVRNELLDGQHRLTACVETGVSFQTLLVTGLPASVFSCLDVGAKRTGGDVLGMAGIANSTTVASAITVVTQLRSGGMVYDCSALSNDAMLQFVSDEPSIVDACSFANSNRSKMMGRGLVGGMVHEFKTTRNGHLAEEFFLRIFDGIGLDKGSPIRVLREKIIASSLDGKAKLRKTTLAAFIIKAWNAYVANRSISVLKWLKDEPYPRIAK